jgi:hypothetical protein
MKLRTKPKDDDYAKILSADLLLLASVFISSSLIATPLLLATTNNAAYAQTSGVTVDIEFVLNNDGTAVVNWRVDNINSIKPATGTYGYEVFLRATNSLMEL